MLQMETGDMCSSGHVDLSGKGCHVLGVYVVRRQAADPLKSCQESGPNLLVLHLAQGPTCLDDLGKSNVPA